MVKRHWATITPKISISTGSQRWFFEAYLLSCVWHWFIPIWFQALHKSDSKKSKNVVISVFPLQKLQSLYSSFLLWGRGSRSNKNLIALHTDYCRFYEIFSLFRYFDFSWTEVYVECIWVGYLVRFHRSKVRKIVVWLIFHYFILHQARTMFEVLVHIEGKNGYFVEIYNFSTWWRCNRWTRCSTNSNDHIWQTMTLCT